MIRSENHSDRYRDASLRADVAARQSLLGIRRLKSTPSSSVDDFCEQSIEWPCIHVTLQWISTSSQFCRDSTSDRRKKRDWNQIDWQTSISEWSSMQMRWLWIQSPLIFPFALVSSWLKIEQWSHRSTSSQSQCQCQHQFRDQRRWRRRRQQSRAETSSMALHGMPSWTLACRRLTCSRRRGEKARDQCPSGRCSRWNRCFM